MSFGPHTISVGQPMSPSRSRIGYDVSASSAGTKPGLPAPVSCSRTSRGSSSSGCAATNHIIARRLRGLRMSASERPMIRFERDKEFAVHQPGADAEFNRIKVDVDDYDVGIVGPGQSGVAFEIGRRIDIAIANWSRCGSETPNGEGNRKHRQRGSRKMNTIKNVV